MPPRCDVWWDVMFPMLNLSRRSINAAYLGALSRVINANIEEFMKQDEEYSSFYNSFMILALEHLSSNLDKVSVADHSEVKIACKNGLKYLFLKERAVNSVELKYMIAVLKSCLTGESGLERTDIYYLIASIKKAKTPLYFSPPDRLAVGETMIGVVSGSLIHQIWVSHRDDRIDSDAAVCINAKSAEELISRFAYKSFVKNFTSENILLAEELHCSELLLKHFMNFKVIRQMRTACQEAVKRKIFLDCTSMIGAVSDLPIWGSVSGDDGRSSTFSKLLEMSNICMLSIGCLGIAVAINCEKESSTDPGRMEKAIIVANEGFLKLRPEFTADDDGTGGESIHLFSLVLQIIRTFLLTIFAANEYKLQANREFETVASRENVTKEEDDDISEDTDPAIGRWLSAIFEEVPAMIDDELEKCRLKLESQQCIVADLAFMNRFGINFESSGHLTWPLQLNSMKVNLLAYVVLCRFMCTDPFTNERIARPIWNRVMKTLELNYKCDDSQVDEPFDANIMRMFLRFSILRFICRVYENLFSVPDKSENGELLPPATPISVPEVVHCMKQSETTLGYIYGEGSCFFYNLYHDEPGNEYRLRRIMFLGDDAILSRNLQLALAHKQSKFLSSFWLSNDGSAPFAAYCCYYIRRILLYLTPSPEVMEICNVDRPLHEHQSSCLLLLASRRYHLTSNVSVGFETTDDSDAADKQPAEYLKRFDFRAHFSCFMRCFDRRKNFHLDFAETMNMVCLLVRHSVEIIRYLIFCVDVPLQLREQSFSQWHKHCKQLLNIVGDYGPDVRLVHKGVVGALSASLRKALRVFKWDEYGSGSGDFFHHNYEVDWIVLFLIFSCTEFSVICMFFSQEISHFFEVDESAYISVVFSQHLENIAGASIWDLLNSWKHVLFSASAVLHDYLNRCSPELSVSTEIWENLRRYFVLDTVLAFWPTKNACVESNFHLVEMNRVSAFYEKFFDFLHHSVTTWVKPCSISEFIFANLLSYLKDEELGEKFFQNRSVVEPISSLNRESLRQEMSSSNTILKTKKTISALLNNATILSDAMKIVFQYASDFIEIEDQTKQLSHCESAFLVGVDFVNSLTLCLILLKEAEVVEVGELARYFVHLFLSIDGVDEVFFNLPNSSIDSLEQPLNSAAVKWYCHLLRLAKLNPGKADLLIFEHFCAWVEKFLQMDSLRSVVENKYWKRDQMELMDLMLFLTCYFSFLIGPEDAFLIRKDTSANGQLCISSADDSDSVTNVQETNYETETAKYVLNFLESKVVAIDCFAATRTGCCSFIVTGRHMCHQKKYYCYDCSVNGKWATVCSACAVKCHNNHDVVYVGNEEMFCQCTDTLKELCATSLNWRYYYSKYLHEMDAISNVHTISDANNIHELKDENKSNTILFDGDCAFCFGELTTEKEFLKDKMRLAQLPAWRKKFVSDDDHLLLCRNCSESASERHKYFYKFCILNSRKSLIAVSSYKKCITIFPVKFPLSRAASKYKLEDLKIDVEDVFIIALNYEGLLDSKKMLKLNMGNEETVRRAFWMPNSASEVVLVTTQRVSVYYLWYSYELPVYCYRLYSGAVADATVAYYEENCQSEKCLTRFIIIMSSDGCLYMEKMGQSQTIPKQDRLKYLRDPLKFAHPDWQDMVVEKLENRGLSVHYSHCLSTLFFGYSNGKNYYCNFSMGSLRNIRTVELSDTGKQSVSIKSWEDVDNLPGFICARPVEFGPILLKFDGPQILVDLQCFFSSPRCAVIATLSATCSLTLWNVDDNYRNCWSEIPLTSSALYSTQFNQLEECAPSILSCRKSLYPAPVDIFERSSLLDNVKLFSEDVLDIATGGWLINKQPLHFVKVNSDVSRWYDFPLTYEESINCCSKITLWGNNGDSQLLDGLMVLFWKAVVGRKHFADTAPIGSVVFHNMKSFVGCIVDILFSSMHLASFAQLKKFCAILSDMLIGDRTERHLSYMCSQAIQRNVLQAVGYFCHKQFYCEKGDSQDGQEHGSELFTVDVINLKEDDIVNYNFSTLSNYLQKMKRHASNHDSHSVLFPEEQQGKNVNNGCIYELYQFNILLMLHYLTPYFGECSGVENVPFLQMNDRISGAIFSFLMDEGILSFCYDVLENMHPKLANLVINDDLDDEKDVVVGHHFADDLWPFFLHDYVEKNDSNLFVLFDQLAVEIALRLPYQLKRLVVTPEVKERLFSSNWIHLLIKLLIYICGSAELCRWHTDRCIFDDMLNNVLRHSRHIFSESTCVSPSQLNTVYHLQMCSMMWRLKICLRIATGRPLSFQKFLLANCEILNELLFAVAVRIHRNITKCVLSLLSVAFDAGSNNTGSFAFSPEMARTLATAVFTNSGFSALEQFLSTLVLHTNEGPQNIEPMQFFQNLMKYDDEMISTMEFLELRCAYEIERIVLTITQKMRIKMIKNMRVYYSSRESLSFVDIATMSYWSLAMNCELVKDQQTVVIDFTVPITARYLLIHYCEFYDIKPKPPPLQTFFNCENCMNSYPDLCTGCTHVALVCENCDGVNMNETAFLCKFCGKSPHATLNYTVRARESASLSPVMNRSDVQSASQEGNLLLAKIENALTAMENDLKEVEQLLEVSVLSAEHDVFEGTETQASSENNANQNVMKASRYEEYLNMYQSRKSCYCCTLWSCNAVLILIDNLLRKVNFDISLFTSNVVTNAFYFFSHLSKYYCFPVKQGFHGKNDCIGDYLDIMYNCAIAEGHSSDVWSTTSDLAKLKCDLRQIFQSVLKKPPYQEVQSVNIQAKYLLTLMNEPGTLRVQIFENLLNRMIPLLSKCEDRIDEFFGLLSELFNDPSWRSFFFRKGFFSTFLQVTSREIERLHKLDRSPLSQVDLDCGCLLLNVLKIFDKMRSYDELKDHLNRRAGATFLYGHAVLRSMVVKRSGSVKYAQVHFKVLMDCMKSGGAALVRSYAEAAFELLRSESAARNWQYVLHICDSIRSVIYPENHLRNSLHNRIYLSTDNDMGPRMRDIKNKICRDCEMIPFIEDDNTLELIVLGKVIALYLDVAEVYKYLWLPESGPSPMIITYRIRGLSDGAGEEYVWELPTTGTVMQILDAVDVFEKHGVCSVIVDLLRIASMVRENRLALLSPEINTIPVIMKKVLLILMDDIKMQGMISDTALRIICRLYEDADLFSAPEFENFSRYHLTELVISLMDVVRNKRKSIDERSEELVMRAVALVTMGNKERIDAVVEYFDTFTDFSRYDKSSTPDEQKMGRMLCFFVNGLPVLLFVVFIIILAVFILKCFFVCSSEMETFLRKPALDYVLKFLNDICRSCEPNQVLVADNCLSIVHTLELIPNNERNLGNLSHQLMVQLNENTATSHKVAAVRERTRLAKKTIATASRNVQLTKLGMRMSKDGIVQIASSVYLNVDLPDEGHFACVICQEGFHVSPHQEMGIYVFMKSLSVRDVLLDSVDGFIPDLVGPSTVTQFNLVHYQCHSNSVEHASSFRYEWDSATLHNANTLCNAILPYPGPEIELNEQLLMMKRYEMQFNEVFPGKPLSCDLVISDLKCLLIRFCWKKSFSTDSHGGGPESNMHLIPYMLYLGGLTLIAMDKDDDDGNRLRSNLSQFLADGSEFWFANAFDVRLCWISVISDRCSVQIICTVAGERVVFSINFIHPVSRPRSLGYAPFGHFETFHMCWTPSRVIPPRWSVSSVLPGTDDNWLKLLLMYISANYVDLYNSSTQLFATYENHLLRFTSFFEFCRICEVFYCHILCFTISLIASECIVFSSMNGRCLREILHVIFLFLPIKIHVFSNNSAVCYFSLLKKPSQSVMLYSRFGNRRPGANMMKSKRSVPTVEEMAHEKLTRIAASYWASFGNAHRPFSAKVVADIYKNELLEKNFAVRPIVLLEFSQYLERFLWPNFDVNTATVEHVMSILVMANEKIRECVPLWPIFFTREKEFEKFFTRVLEMSLDDELLTIAEQLHVIIFLNHCFTSVAAREQCLNENMKLKKYWKYSQKQFDKLDEESKRKTLFYWRYICDLIKKFLKILHSIPPEDEQCDLNSIRYCERFLEMLIDMESLLPIRRFLNVVLLESRILCHGALSTLVKRQDGGLFTELLSTLKRCVYFEIDDLTGESLTQKDMTIIHVERITKLQKYKEKMKTFYLSTVSEVDNRKNLFKYFSVLSDEELLNLCVDLNLVDPNNTNDSTLNRPLLMEMMVCHHEKQPSQLDRINEMSLYPSEEILWNEKMVPVGYFKNATCLALPKLGLQFLTVYDYLLRNFTLFRLESTYEIRLDIEDAIFRMQPWKHEIEPNTLVCGGWARMALPIMHFVVIEVGRPRVGEKAPSVVRADVQLMLDVRQDVRTEWESLRKHDVGFLLTIRPTALPGTLYCPSEPFLPQIPVVYVRGCEIEGMLGVDGNVIEEYAPPEAKLGFTNNVRTFRVLLDCQQYRLDMMQHEKGGEDVYQTFNVFVRRKPKENNFKAVLDTIRQLMNCECVVPSWFNDLLLGYGDPSVAHYSKMEKQFTVLNFDDTFLSVEHVKESFPDEYEIIANENDLKPPYRISVDETDKKVCIFQEKDESRGPYPFCRRRFNAVLFTKAQVDGIYSGMQHGLTVIVGPPGTGKTDVAAQIINNIYHGWPSERTLVVAHSNQALNYLFQKITERDVDERHLLRLGHGEEFLGMGKDFSREGRVNHILEKRLQLLGQVERLQKSIQVVGGDVASSCETALYFYEYQLQPRWFEFQRKSKQLRRVGEIFPFGAFFDDLDGPLFLDDDGDEEKGELNYEQNMQIAHSCWNYIRNIFDQLAEFRAFESLRTRYDRVEYLLTSQAKVIAMTCTHAALRRKEFVDMYFHYDNLIVEEAAQILEIETFIPFLLQPTVQGKNRLRRLVLIGDHYQLPPVVKSPALRRYSRMEQSMFTRLVRLGVRTIHLDKQGRARQQLAALYSWRYDNLGNLPHVLANEEFLTANAGFAHPFQLVDVDDFNGDGETTPVAYFYQNLAEAEYAVAIFMYMRIVGYPAEKITILTTYNGQKHLIRDVLRKRCASNIFFGKPAKVTTVDKYQGEQNDYIILSLVRTEAVGHIRDVRRLVVAFSRGRLGLYVLARVSLFENCFELTPAFRMFQNRPRKLIIIPNETWPTKRL
ncbi:conserved hypothetical protein, partial [Trichinella spiralis]|uniref:hypothetical protein n=1 Tax=Trichinella spiralis TaxID=6334 RepID=UPI0001F0EB32